MVIIHLQVMKRWNMWIHLMINLFQKLETCFSSPCASENWAPSISFLYSKVQNKRNQRQNKNRFIFFTFLSKNCRKKCITHCFCDKKSVSNSERPNASGRSAREGIINKISGSMLGNYVVYILWLILVTQYKYYWEYINYKKKS